MKLDEIAEHLEDGRCQRDFSAVFDDAERHDDESWKYVVTPDFTSRDYVVSDFGRVLSLPRYRTYAPNAQSQVRHRKFLPGRLLKPGAQSSGHLTVTIVHNKERYSTHVHRLVAWAFLGPQPDGYHVVHLDGDPANNRLENLEYRSPYANLADHKVPASTSGDVHIAVGPKLRTRMEAAIRGETDPVRVLKYLLEKIPPASQS